MDEVKLKEIDSLFVKDINLKNLDFYHLEYMKDHNLGIFYKETPQKREIISYGFEYNYRNYDPIKMPVEKFRSWITFTEIELILATIIPDLNNIKAFENPWQFIFYSKKTLLNIHAPSYAPDNFFYEIYKNGEIRIDNISELAQQSNIFIKKYHLPFFEKFATIKDINDKILEKHDWLEWGNYIEGETFYKALIIMKLCNNYNKYNEFSTMYKSRIFDAIQEGSKDLIPYYDNLIKVIDYLDRGEYKKII